MGRRIQSRGAEGLLPPLLHAPLAAVLLHWLLLLHCADWLLLQITYPTKSICFDVYDKNSIVSVAAQLHVELIVEGQTKDELVGSVNVPVGTLLDGQVHEQWFELTVADNVAQKVRRSAVKPKVRCSQWAVRLAAA